LTRPMSSRRQKSKDGVKMDNETIRNLIHNNQVAIGQLGKDIQALAESIEKRWLEIEKAQKTMYRDIQDRWEMISTMNKEIEKLSKKK